MATDKLLDSIARSDGTIDLTFRKTTLRERIPIAEKDTQVNLSMETAAKLIATLAEALYAVIPEAD